jgi:drug/metabolite transporter, DME family
MRFMSETSLTTAGPRHVGGGAVPLTTSLVGLGAGVVWSFGATLARMADGVDAWQYLIWRSVGIIVVIETINIVRGRRSPLGRAFRDGWLMFAGCCSLFVASIGFVYAVKNTSAANAAFLSSMSPLIAAVFGRVFLGERMSRVTLVAIALSVVGLAIMVVADRGGGNVKGNVAAVCASFGFALYTLCLRRDRVRNWDPIMPGYALMMIVVCSTITMTSGHSLVPGGRDIALALLHGGVLITIGTTMFNAASRKVPAVAMAVFAQTETVFVPLWVFLKFSEQPTWQTLLGGGLILVAVVGKAILDNREARMAVGLPG